jgi:hypothetical protein
MENQQLDSPSRQCSSTPVGFGQGFLSKEQRDNTAASPYSPDLATADLYLFPGLKSALEGQRLCDTPDIIKNATEELKRLSQNGFEEYFQHRYSRWQKCAVAPGDYFEGNITYIIALLCISQN